jgi:hypothetical protein
MMKGPTRTFLDPEVVCRISAIIDQACLKPGHRSDRQPPAVEGWSTGTDRATFY